MWWRLGAVNVGVAPFSACRPDESCVAQGWRVLIRLDSPDEAGRSIRTWRQGRMSACAAASCPEQALNRETLNELRAVLADVVDEAPDGVDLELHGFVRLQEA